MKREREKKAAEVDLIVIEVEQSKQIHLSHDERAALIVDLLGTGESVETIRQWGENVKRATTFARLSIDVWLESAEVYTGEEVNRLVEQRIDYQRKNFVDLQGKMDPEAIARAGLSSARLYLREEWSRAVERECDRQMEHFRRKQKALSKMDAVMIRDLYAECIVDGLITRDPFAESREDYMRIYLRSNVVAIEGKIEVMLKRMK